MPYSHLTNAVISDADAEMIQKPVTVRDGDDLVEVNLGEADETELEEELSTEEPEEEEEAEEESAEEESEEEDDESGTEEGEGTDSEEMELPEYQKVDPADMNEAGALIIEAEKGQSELIAKAIENGMAAEAVETAKAEWEKDGKFSESSYAALAAAGYSKSFIDSYMAGQAAVAERFAETIFKYVGGQENFETVSKHIAEHKPDVATAFDAAVARNDVATIRALLDSAAGELTKTPKDVTKHPKRNLAVAAKAAKVAAKVNKVEGFTNRQEMVKAMSDVRYQKDAAFRREVELKVFHSTF